jgi:hypothetical protein
VVVLKSLDCKIIHLVILYHCFKAKCVQNLTNSFRMRVAFQNFEIGFQHTPASLNLTSLDKRKFCMNVEFTVIDPKMKETVLAKL